MSRRLSRVLVAASVLSSLFALSLLAGCSARNAESTATQPGATRSASANLRLMTPSEKQKLIDPAFPMQVPVPFGTVVRGEAQGQDAYDYEVVLGGSVPTVAQWYRDAYERAEWTLVSDSGTVLTFSKNDAQSQITLSADKNAAGPGASTQAIVTVGIGTPVLQTQ